MRNAPKAPPLEHDCHPRRAAEPRVQCVPRQSLGTRNHSGHHEKHFACRWLTSRIGTMWPNRSCRRLAACRSQARDTLDGQGRSGASIAGISKAANGPLRVDQSQRPLGLRHCAATPLRRRSTMAKSWSPILLNRHSPACGGSFCPSRRFGIGTSLLCDRQIPVVAVYFISARWTGRRRFRLMANKSASTKVATIHSRSTFPTPCVTVITN